MPLYAPSVTNNLISAFTFSGSETSYTFSNIPQSLTDLRLVFRGRSDRAAQTTSTLALRFNGDTGANYFSQLFNGNATTVSSTGADDAATALAALDIPAATAPAGSASLIEWLIGAYASSTLHKAVQISGGRRFGTGTSNKTVTRHTAWWGSTSPLTSIQIYDTNSAAFTSGSTVSLYGSL